MDVGTVSARRGPDELIVVKSLGGLAGCQSHYRSQDQCFEGICNHRGDQGWSEIDENQLLDAGERKLTFFSRLYNIREYLYLEGREPVWNLI